MKERTEHGAYHVEERYGLSVKLADGRNGVMEVEMATHGTTLRVGWPKLDEVCRLTVEQSLQLLDVLRESEAVWRERHTISVQWQEECNAGREAQREAARAKRAAKKAQPATSAEPDTAPRQQRRGENGEQ